MPDWVDENARGINSIVLEPIPEVEFEQVEEIVDEDETKSEIHDEVEDFSDLEIISETDSSPSMNSESNPETCPVCGTEASVGASMCETCSYQFK